MNVQINIIAQFVHSVCKRHHNVMVMIFILKYQHVNSTNGSWDQHRF